MTKKWGKRILSKRLGAFEHKRFEIPNARKKTGKTDRKICQTLSSEENNFDECNRTRFAKYSKDTSGSQC